MAFSDSMKPHLTSSPQTKDRTSSSGKKLQLGLASFFVPVTSAWYPLLHNVSLYGGLGLFTLYVAYDTQKMIDEYEMGEDDHLKHAVDLFIDFKVIFTRVLVLLMGRDE